MTITNYTFFSPNGDDFPVTANSDAKLYMMLTGMNYDNYRVKFWKNPINTALNRVYTNVSLVVGGRYFELTDHAINLTDNMVNYVHAVIQLANTENPVTLTVENSNTSNSTDINNDSGVLKICFDVVTTLNGAVTSASRPTGQTANFNKIVANDEEISTESVTMAIGNGVSASFQRKGEIVNIRWSGSLTSINSGVAFANKAPVQMRPNGTKELIGHYASGDNSFHIDLETDGTFRWWGRNSATGAVRGSAVYFIK